jgi:hypothetical protein
MAALLSAEREDVGWRSREWEMDREPPRRGPAESISSLQAREKHIRELGVDGVLREFGMEDVR